MSLQICDLHARIVERTILRGISLEIRPGETHAIMGPNGSGKSTLSKVLAGHPDYEVTQGSIVLDGVSLLEREPDERARMGLFLAFQYPCEIPGVSIANFLRAAAQTRLPEGQSLSVTDFYQKLYQEMDALGMQRTFSSRPLNAGFSGGEKKRAEILQMAILHPRYSVLDETDSGLDIDALKVVAGGVNRLRGPETGFLIITHYQRLLDYVAPDFVHVMVAGRIVQSGGPELALELEKRGYGFLEEQYGSPDASPLAEAGVQR
ncbi:Fe-S cluster assembly ATPase SufC [Verrucomicrobium sp. 3C]|uniref:Fe-S cluster assembly ATPase SufC n=1 Tax=Verrucomicrobium sp. 3C TaxID=1134055 RepID=UPI0006874B5E|nr:Fe-S cluster assembly ATPase SufC [Verrucomicrobium sp. 3C]